MFQSSTADLPVRPRSADLRHLVALPVAERDDRVRPVREPLGQRGTRAVVGLAHRVGELGVRRDLEGQVAPTRVHGLGRLGQHLVVLLATEVPEQVRRGVVAGRGLERRVIQRCLQRGEVAGLDTELGALSIADEVEELVRGNLGVRGALGHDGQRAASVLRIDRLSVQGRHRRHSEIPLGGRRVSKQVRRHPGPDGQRGDRAVAETPEPLIRPAGDRGRDQMVVDELLPGLHELGESRVTEVDTDVLTIGLEGSGRHLPHERGEEACVTSRIGRDVVVRTERMDLDRVLVELVPRRRRRRDTRLLERRLVVEEGHRARVDRQSVDALDSLGRGLVDGVPRAGRVLALKIAGTEPCQVGKVATDGVLRKRVVLDLPDIRKTGPRLERIRQRRVLIGRPPTVRDGDLDVRVLLLERLDDVRVLLDRGLPRPHGHVVLLVGVE
ncbi:hypothetical protein SDC9_58457 [bioreactor metagenome]|uniref:Uncharacterized protein n=1 Tax=bioreactor metagenome TaxID=1076179 RepID=A0A644X7F2_9ZZZZ